ncbi:hypothetical protein MMC20_001579 [Loxospora ochrophaea]|nr:hypothetical protein [Loxospora ochrophaea]
MAGEDLTAVHPAQPPTNRSPASESNDLQQIDNLEHRLRKMIYSHGSPSNMAASIPSPLSNDVLAAVQSSSSDEPMLNVPEESQVLQREIPQAVVPEGWVPPHLRTASPATQAEYLQKHREGSRQEDRSSASNAKDRQRCGRLNQAQRRQRQNRLDVSPALAQMTANETRPFQNTRQDAGPLQHAGVRCYQYPRGSRSSAFRGNRSPLPSGPPTTLGRQQDSRSLHQPFSAQFNQTDRELVAQQDSYARPPTSHHQLFDPRAGEQPRFLQQQNNFESHKTGPTSAEAQISFLEWLAKDEIPKAAISSQELQEKEYLRLRLENTCRTAVAVFEKTRDPEFDAKSVSLKCFGSLSSGYATRSSDMDLVLMSPKSIPDIANPESEVPRVVEKALLDVRYGARLLTRTRVPIIKVCEKPTPELTEALDRERDKWEEERNARVASKELEGECQVQKGKEPENLGDDPSENKEVVADTLKHETRIKISKSFPEKVVKKPFSTERGMDDSEAKARTTISASAQPGSDNVKDPTTEDNLGHEVSGDTAKQNPTENKISIPEENSGTPRSDDELVRLYQLAIGEGWFDESERAIIRTFTNAVEKHHSDEENLDLVVARNALQALPDVLKRYRDKPPRPESHLDFPKDGIGAQCDINFSNHLALHNTRLLRCYACCDRRVQDAVIFVKAWAKKRKINSPYHGTLSSYGYVLMVLDFLMNVAQPPVIPNLQLWQPTRGETRTEAVVDGYHVTFWSSEKEICQAASRGLLTNNRESLGSLLRGFFQYFAYQGPGSLKGGFCWATDVLSLRSTSGRMSKKEKGWTGLKTTALEPTSPGHEGKGIKHRYLFAIEDPFEIDHNIARTVAHHGIVAIREEFRRATRIIRSAGLRNDGTRANFFSDAGENANLQPYLFFGPRPRPDTKARDQAQKSSISKSGGCKVVSAPLGDTVRQEDNGIQLEPSATTDPKDNDRRNDGGDAPGPE